MEEKDTKAPKLTYEQLEQAVMQFQQRLMMAENKLRTIDFASMRLTWLFKVIENKDSFSAEYVNQCAKEVEDILTIEEVTSEETSEETPKAKPDKD